MLRAWDSQTTHCCTLREQPVNLEATLIPKNVQMYKPRTPSANRLKSITVRRNIISSSRHAAWQANRCTKKPQTLTYILFQLDLKLKEFISSPQSYNSVESVCKSSQSRWLQDTMKDNRMCCDLWRYVRLYCIYSAEGATEDTAVQISEARGQRSRCFRDGFLHRLLAWTWGAWRSLMAAQFSSLLTHLAAKVPQSSCCIATKWLNVQ